jgi:hypothetical protein
VSGCGRRRYRDRVAAQLALASCGRRRHSRRARDERRVYECRHCNGWHLTSEVKHVRIRVMGTERECAATVGLLRTVLEVQSVSEFAPNRGSKTVGRVYVTVTSPET